MKFWIESADDAYAYFDWFSKNDAENEIGYVPELNVFSMIGSMLYSKKEKKEFLTKCSELLSRAFNREEGLGYSFYLFGVIETSNVNSKIFKHRKLWNNLKKDQNLEGLLLGPEIEYKEHNHLRYASMAKFQYEDFEKILNIIISNPKKFAVIASNNAEVLSESSIRNLYNKVYIHRNGKEQIDVFKLVLNSCPNGDLVFRWGDAGEECELDIISEKSVKSWCDRVSFNS